MAEASPRAVLRACVLLLLLASGLALAPPDARAQDEHQHTLTVGVTGQGRVSGGSIACPGNCSGVFIDLETEVCNELGCHTVYRPPRVTLRAFADPGWHLADWSPCTGTSVCSLLLDVPEVTVGATFANDAPVVSAGVGAVLTGTASLTATASDHDGVQQVRFLVDDVDVGAANAAFALAWNSATVADGAHSVKARATDNAGQSAVSSPVAVVVDNTPPSLSITDGPDGAVFAPGSTQTWSFTAADATTGPVALACRLDGAAPGPCTSAGTMTLSGVASGTHALDVLATDGAGLTTQAARSFTIDGVAPRTTITSGVADGARSAQTAYTFGFAADEPGVEFACRVFPAALTPPPFGTCSAADAHTAAGFGPGSYAFEVRGTDAFGNVEADPQRRTFTVLGEREDGVQAVGTRGRLGSEPGGVAFGLSYQYKRQGEWTWFTRLAVKELTPRARLAVRCRGGGCPRKPARKRAHGLISITGLLRRRLHAGAVVTFVATKPGLRGRELRLIVRDGRPPAVRRSCFDAGGKRAKCRG